MMVSSDDAPADVGKTPGGAAVQLQPGRTVAPDDLDVAPQHALRMAGAERFHRRFLRGEPLRPRSASPARAGVVQ